jgi:carboxyl-terminal processing protease
LVVNPIPGGPSEKLGVIAGDRIIKIDGKNVAGIKISNNDVFSKLRGKKGTIVTISVLRHNYKNLIDFTITRDKIPIYSIDAKYMLMPEVGYIKLNRFAQTTGKEMEEAMQILLKKGMESLVLDLTGNGGGYLEEAVNLADHFLDKKKLIVYTKGEHSPQQNYESTSYGLFEKGKLIVLIDESSASASEILAGAIQDWDRGIIIGRRSFGKGLVQRPFYLPDASMLRLTVARYYTPGGRSIQKSYEKGYNDYEKDLLKRYTQGEFSNKDSIHFNDSLKSFTLVNKRVVYGGGGIMPDIFVPIDTLGYTDYYRDILRKGILNRFVIDYIDKHRDNLKATYTNFESYKNTFTINAEILSELRKFAETDSVKTTNEQFEKSKDEISKLLIAYIARDLWDSSEFYEIFNADEPIINKAKEVINNWDNTQKSLNKK